MARKAGELWWREACGGARCPPPCTCDGNARQMPGANTNVMQQTDMWIHKGSIICRTQAQTKNKMHAQLDSGAGVWNTPSRLLGSMRRGGRWTVVLGWA